MFLFFLVFVLFFERRKYISCVGYNKIIGGDGRSESLSLKTVDNDVYLFGKTRSFDSYYDSPDQWLTRFSFDGKKVFSFTLGNTGTSAADVMYSFVKRKNDTSLLVVGAITNSNYPTITKLNVTDTYNFSTVWTRRVNLATGKLNGMVVDPSDEDNIIFIGEVQSGAEPGFLWRIFLFPITPEGYLQEGTARRNGWGTREVFVRSADSLRKYGDDGFFVSGTTTKQQTTRDFYVVKFHYNLTLAWYVWAGVSAKNMDIGSAIELENGYIVVVGNQDIVHCSLVYVFDVSSGKGSIDLLFGKKYCSETGNDVQILANDVSESETAIVVVGYYKGGAGGGEGGFILRLDKETGDVLSAKTYLFLTVDNDGNDWQGGFVSATNQRKNVSLTGEMDYYGKDGTLQVIVVGLIVTDSGTNREALLIKLDENDDSCGFNSIVNDIKVVDVSDRWGELDITKFSICDNLGQSQTDIDNTISTHDCQIEETENCYSCFGVDEDNVMVCSGHGQCRDWDDCNCTGAYDGISCEMWSCFGILATNLSTVCTPAGVINNNSTKYEETDAVEGLRTGVCLDRDFCQCFPGYSSDFFGGPCTEWECHGVSWRDSENVCDGNSKCISAGVCEVESCYGIISSDITRVCTIENNVNEIRTGVCVGHDLCICFPGYDSLTENGPCTEWNCNHKSWKDTDKVCSGFGECIESETCVCIGGFEGDDCETWSCGEIDHKDKYTCNGKGKCESPNVCKCKSGFAGKECDQNIMYFSVMLPVLSTFAFSLFIGIVFVLCCIFCAVLCCVFFVSGCCLINFLRIILKQRKGIAMFGKLRNFDLLLKEQELDDDESIAHLRVNRGLFEIPYDEIKIDRVLGEGGSQSVVFLAEWLGEVVAFKCFKTRQVMTSQNDFDDFEREVEILSSLNHPNIIRFYGATIKPPRIGIVMEFCSKGELFEFFDDFKEKNPDVCYPINEKIRIIGECVNAMVYCHSRSIIHRDLKCENVLINESENAKLMDFGLSKVVEKTSSKSGHMTKTVGTSIYMAPEVVSSEIYGSPCDVFSFSIMLFVIITENEKPYGKNEFRIEFKVSNNENFRPNLIELDPILKNKKSLKWLKYIIKRCWAHNPNHRLEFSQISQLFKEHLDNVDHSKEVSLQETEDDEDESKMMMPMMSAVLPKMNEEKNGRLVFSEKEKLQVEELKEELDSCKRLMEEKDNRIRELENEIFEFKKE